MVIALLDFEEAQIFANQSQRLRSLDELDLLLREVCARMGGTFFALSHHIDFVDEPEKGLRLHNYPESWREKFDAKRLGTRDPIHRASQRTSTGFHWHDVSHLIALNREDEHVLTEAREHGIGDGLTIPAHIPGEARGSVSFAWSQGDDIPTSALPYAQLIGIFSFEAARRIRRVRAARPHPRLTPRQRDCIVLVARGKTDGEIATALGISRETVIDYLRCAREQYETRCRASLTARALADGEICFSDI